jgi:short-subunit dehydrogenase
MTAPEKSLADFKERYGPWALITGASSGIGKAFAETLALRGLNLVLVARRLGRLQEIAGDLSVQHGVQTITLEADLAMPEVATTIAAETASLDVGLLVSNAGFSIKGEHADNDPDEMTRMLMVNCHAPMQLTHAFIPRLRTRGRGGIILTSSVEGLIGVPYSGAYSATKALVKALGEALWAELRGYGVDVLTLCPGATETEAIAKSGHDLTKMQNLMKAADVATQTLDRIADGPIFVSSDHYRAMFEKLTAMPRGEALIAMAAGMKAARTG